MAQTTTSTIPLFDKCLAFTTADDFKAQGLYPYFKAISESEDTVVVIEGRKRIMLGSNNYLGLTHHPKVLEAASCALHRYGSGCTGSRSLNGSLDLHVQLERALAEFLGKDDCIVFSTGYGANLGLISGLVSRGEIVFGRGIGFTRNRDPHFNENDSHLSPLTVNRSGLLESRHG